MGDVFGGGGDGADIQQVNKLTKGQQTLLNSLTSLLSGQVGKGYPQYPGATIAPMTATQRGLYDTMGGLPGAAGKALDYYAKVLGGMEDVGLPGALGDARNVLEDLSQPFDEEAYWQRYKRGVQPMINEFGETLRPTVERYAGAGAVKSGAFGKTLAEEETQMLERLAGAGWAGMEGAIERTNQLRLGAAGLLANLPGLGAGLLQGAGSSALGMLGGATTLAAGEQAQEQAVLSDAARRWSASQGYANPWLQYLPTALGVQSFDTIASEPEPGLLETLGPAAIMGGSMMGASALSSGASLTLK